MQNVQRFASKTHKALAACELLESLDYDEIEADSIRASARREIERDMLADDSLAFDHDMRRYHAR